MDFDWKEYFNLAKFLTGDKTIVPHPEAKLRSAVSRAYFAAYCYSRNFACKFFEFVQSDKDKVKDHKRLRACLRSNGYKGTARKLDDMRGFRNDCDYDDVVPNLHPYVKMSLERAEKVFKELT